MPIYSSLPTKTSRTAVDYYPSVLHEEALARLAYLAEKDSTCGLLLGPDGCGKSLVLSLFAHNQRQNGAAVAAVSLLGASSQETLAAIASAWGAEVRNSDSLAALWQRTTDRLRVLNFEQVPALLLLDDMDQARDEAAVLIDRIHAFAEGSGANLVLIVAADDRSQGLLSSRLVARAELRVELDAWNCEESSGFLQQWLSHRSGEGQEFDSQAMEVLHDLTDGIPRRVRQLAELTLLAGSATGEKLGEEIVEAAFQELNLGR